MKEIGTAICYPVPGGIVAGVTVRDPSRPEANNMALHVCDDTERVMENRRKLADFLHCGPDDLVCADQCHSSNFYKVAAADRGKGSAAKEDAIPRTDALYTYEAGLVLCCFTADCVPLILYNEKNGLTGIVHSGWGGTVGEITPKILEQLIRRENNDAGDLCVIIGPAISQEKFQVDRDVCDRFKALGYADGFISFNGETGKYHIDNQLVVKRQCELQGIPARNIFVDRTCTYSSPHCFSHRRDPAGGRQLSFILRKV